MSHGAGKGALSGLNALVTGAGTGIGKGIAIAFAGRGANVAISGRRKEPLEETAAEIRKTGNQCTVITGDVSNPADAARMVKDTVAAFGSLQLLVNNAGIARLGPLAQTADADIAAILNTNVAGLCYVTKAAIPELAKHPNKAAILNISSCVADKPLKDFGVYSASKAAVVHLTKCLGLELAAAKIRVNCINPGAVETPIFESMVPAEAIAKTLESYAQITPLGRVGQPKDIASAALFLVNPHHDWITGAVLTVDGGIALT